MDLLLDLGNSRLKWAWAVQGRLVDTGAKPWPEYSASELLAAAAGDRAPRRVALAAVAVEEMGNAMIAAVEHRWAIGATRLLATAHCAGVQNGYTQSAQLGVDRFAALVGAWARQPGCPAVVVDAGSALTVDVLDGTGRHLGGSIAPGLTLARESFFLRTRRPELRGAACADGLARNTADAVASGALVAALGAVSHIWHLHRAHSEMAPALWLTGGDAPALAAALEIPHTLAPHLVLEGMVLMLGDRA